MSIPRHFANQLARSFTKLMGGEASAGILLIIVAMLALIVANTGWAYGYHELFHHELAWTPISKLDSLHLWINDALMAVFFFVVGLEIKREILDGELSNAAKRRLPVLAAAAGMVMPALIYLMTTGTKPPLAHGWAIPAATDIAFAVGVLALLGKRVPASLRLFLLTVAIVDDLGAVMIIAVFYTKIDAGTLYWGIGALLFLAGLILANRRGVHHLWVFLILGFGLWYCILNSGIHATIAGVIFAFTIPLRPLYHGDSMLLRLEHALVPWNSYVIVPLFGFANAGVALGGIGLAGLSDPIPLGVALGLFLGKQIGIFAAIVISDRIGFAPRPAGASWVQLWGTSVLCGIGFTMSLFIGALAFPRYPHLVEEAKLGVLLGSLLSSLLGYAILRMAKTPQAEQPD
ncbi:Na+/H+ antiporter NhaA [Novosphingobium mangrovi (ex Huang et al. 2023)]|uniref:Na(+)/H(+) antiporter NhaA n=1 Tax=Novosphingobium mangrovi (ex Huang et al. 2023) TaxID=2976432 RepID=A0ABT2I4H4_9SPHN|nr:Na+/H+ antiporter NhaA [Novosphingobium mangrovi (ex Huang et al. 2023)]MCT2399713.1 Na+/H+ antiporter NhaA [Novosphingobium mangrovi (ex Huang et al. 2023)]